jgi:uncharacterized protein
LTLLANLILFASAVLQSVAGFGFNLVSTPLLILVYPPSVAVPVLVVLSIPIGIALAGDSLRHVQWKRVFTLLASALLGVPLGAYALRVVPEEPMKVTIGVVTLALAGLLGLGGGQKMERERLGILLVGVVSGFLGGATGMSGPPLVLFGLNQQWESRGFRADMIAYFTLLGLATLPFYFREGLLTREATNIMLWTTPGLIAGFFVGVWIARRTSQSAFRRLAFVVLVVAGVLPLASALFERM